MQAEQNPAWTPARYAYLYCKQFGFQLVPLPPRTKRPVRDDWGHHLLADPDQAREYFERNPDWNMGVALGPSRLCSLDVDDIEATQAIFGEFGWDLSALVANHPTIQGQAPGLRVMFSVPDGVSLPYHSLSWPKKDDPKKRFTVFEIRAADEQQRQDVLPPSIHPDTGQPYAWITRPTGDRGFPPPPDFLLQIWANWDSLKPQFQDVCPWAEKAVPAPRRQPVPRQGASVIGAYDDAHSITECLARYGYRQQGKRWLSPHSKTGLPGVMVFEADNKAYIHHASDPLCSVDSGKPVAPFDLFCAFEHGGDIGKATRAAGDLLGMPMPNFNAQRAQASAKKAKAAPRETVDPETGEITPADVAANDNTPDGPQVFQWPEPIDLFGVSQPPALSIDMLPEALQDYVRDQAERMGCDPGVIGLSAIVSAAACIHDGIQLQPLRHDYEWTESARLWAVVVGDPSTKKSPAIGKAVRHVKRIDMRMAEENASELAEYLHQHEQWKDAKKASKDNPPPEPKKPQPKRLVVDDTTIEALSEVLKDNSRGVLTIKDELTGWFAAMDAYKGGGKGASMDRSKWLEAYNGGRQIIDRVQRGNIIVPNWSTCIVGGIQPDMMRKVASSMGNDGLLQRFIVLVARSAGATIDRVPDRAAIDQFNTLFDHLVSIQPSSSRVHLTEAAHTVRERVESRANRMVSAFDHPHIQAWLGKWTGLFARLLLTFHVIECASMGKYPADRQVTGETAERVESLMCDVLLHHAIHFYTEVIDAHERQENVRQLARTILAKRFTRITKRDLTLHWKTSRRLEGWEMRATIETLCNMAWLEPEESSTDPMDGKPRAWVVNPKVHEVFAKQADREAARRREAMEVIREIKATAGGR